MLGDKKVLVVIDIRRQSIVYKDQPEKMQM